MWHDGQHRFFFFLFLFEKRFVGNYVRVTRDPGNSMMEKEFKFQPDVRAYLL